MDVLGTEKDLVGGHIIETDQITTFVQDEVPIVHEKDLIPLVPKWNDHASDLRTHDVVSILERPIILVQGKLTPTFAFTPLAMPDAIIAASSNIRAKLGFFTFFRANIRVKIVFNATPFMSGKYLLWFAPFEGYTNRVIPDTLSCKTGYPCVELDIARGSSVELKIPYCAPLSHYDLPNAQSYMGKLHLDAITGTLEGTSPSLGAPYTLYAWFEDVQISMPSSSTPTTFPAPPAILEAQVYSEESVKARGPTISAISGGVASTARLFSNIVPRFSGFLKPVEWVARALSAAASSVGMNKPVSLSQHGAVYNIPAKGFTHMDGVDASVVLGATPDNALTLPSGLFATNVDEMDIGYVCKNSCIATPEKDWTTSDVVGTTLFSCPVTPGYCPTSGSTIQPTILAFVSSVFERWTGGLRYRLAVSKTAFHSGRLRITFHPVVFDPSDTSLVAENAYNWVLDLAVSSELDFVIPYVANTQWKDVRLGDAVTSNSVSVSTGMLTVTVLTPLVVANAAASVRAPFYVWLSAADDFSLAIPSCPRYVPLETVVLEDFALEAQIWNDTGPDSTVNQEAMSPDVRLFPKVSIDPTLPEQLTIGEKIVSLRSLVKRFCKTSIGAAGPYPNVAGTDYSFPGPIPTSGSTVATSALTLDPAYFGTNGVAYTNARADVLGNKYFSDGTGILALQPAVVAQNLQSQALIHYLSYLYTFWTGSKRYKVFFGQNTSAFPVAGTLESTDATTVLNSVTYAPRVRTNIPMSVFRDTQITDNGVIAAPVLNTGPSTTVDRVDSRFESVVYPDLDGCLEFAVPYYGRTPISLIAQGTANSNRGIFVSRNKVIVQVGFQFQDAISPFFSVVGTNVSATYSGRTVEDIGAYVLYEAAGDDFSFGYLHGAPNLVNTRAF